MILIADSGGTKTEWVLCENGVLKGRFQTDGINPFITSEERISEIISKQVREQLHRNSPGKIYFYGAGCSSTENKELLHKHLRNTFGSACIEVEHDLLAAARALCGKEKGIVSILGTGSNACVFNGETITKQITSLGFYLGDEGSGAYIGKTLLNSFFYNELPEELHQKFVECYHLSLNDVLDTVYKKPAANAYLASFTRFLKDEIDHPYCIALVTDCFDLFFKKHVNKWGGNLTVHALGSVAYHFKDQLILAAIENNKQIGNVLLNPIEGLINYHR